MGAAFNAVLERVTLSPLPMPASEHRVPIACETLRLPTALGDRTALVLTPTRPIVLSKSLNPADGSLSATDRWIVTAARHAVDAQLATVCLFRGRADDGPGIYRFSDGLPFSDATDVAEAMLTNQLRMCREMVRLGLCLFVHASFGYTETEAFRAAVDRLVHRLEREDSPSTKVDLWILQNLVFFFTASFEALATSVLPDKLPMMEKRMERVRRMVAMLPP